jgi:hypothetical protein
MKLKLVLYSLTVAFLLAVGVVATVPSGAQAAYENVAADCRKGAVLGLEHWYKYLEVGEQNGDACAIKGPVAANDAEQLDWPKIVPRVLLAVVEAMLRIAGIVAVAFTIYGGFMYIISQGEPDATKKAKGTIIGASIGVIIAIFATFIAGFVGSILWG